MKTTKTFKEKFDSVFQYLLVGAIVSSFFLVISAFGQGTDPGNLPVEIVTPPPGFEWLGGLLTWVESFPKIGPVIVNAAKYVGAIATLFTALSLAVQGVLRLPEIAARWAGANKLADKIYNFNERIKPWLNYLSIFNAQVDRRKTIVTTTKLK